MNTLQEVNFLVCRTTRHIVALPVNQVVETTRALPLDPVAAMPGYVLGVSILRGEPVPVIDVEGLLGRPTDERPKRYVIIRVHQRRVALALAGVEGVVELNEKQRHDLPPLFDDQSSGAEDQSSGAIGSLAVRDRQVLEVLESARLFSEDLWRKLEPLRADHA